VRKVGVIGLGNIGLEIASKLMTAGFNVTGHSRSPKNELVKQGLTWADSVDTLCQAADVIIHCLPSASVLESVVTKELPSVKPGQIVIDISSYDLQDKENAAKRLAASGVVMLDCEVSGLPSMLANGTATIFQSGDRAAVNSLEEVFAAISQKCFYLGEFGTATTMKLFANAMVAVHNLMGAEILNLAAQSGVDPTAVFDILKNSAGGSTTFTNKAPIMLSREFTDGAGPFRNMFHYMSRVKALADESGASTPLIDTTLQYFQQAEVEGRGDQDIAAIIELLENEK
jgi:3-hydroxyisobutyrate dehydrogenase-like beta-hydroxyacid dehydrogenase